MDQNLLSQLTNMITQPGWSEPLFPGRSAEVIAAAKKYFEETFDLSRGHVLLESAKRKLLLSIYSIKRPPFR